jgi:hypothetical protein
LKAEAKTALYVEQSSIIIPDNRGKIDLLEITIITTILGFLEE